jgi:hypothetical protein
MQLTGAGVFDVDMVEEAEELAKGAVVGDCSLARGVEHGQEIRTVAFRAQTQSGSCTEL